MTIRVGQSVVHPMNTLQDFGATITVVIMIKFTYWKKPGAVRLSLLTKTANQLAGMSTGGQRLIGEYI